MNKEIIGLLFGVEGGADVDKGSGKLIVKDLTDIVKKINAGSTSVPKLALSIDIEETTKSLKAAINEITSALGGGAIKFTGLEKIESSLDVIAGGSDRLAKGLIMIFGKLDSILNSMPGDFDLTSKSAVKSIEAITSKVNDLVAGIESLSATVTEISQKPSSIVNNIIGGTSEDLERLSLLKQKAKEIMSAYADTYRVVSSISGTSTLTGAYTSKYKSGGRAAEAMNAQAKLFNGAIASSETIEKVKDINSLIQEYGRSINELIDVMEIANSRGANLFVPDYSNYKKASDALKEYDARQKETTPDSSSPEAKSVLEYAKDISTACTGIEDRLDVLREKIKSTFDFSTIDPDVSKILSAIDVIKDRLEVVKDNSRHAASGSVNQERKQTQEANAAQKSSFDEQLKNIKEFFRVRTEMQKLVARGGVTYDEETGRYDPVSEAYKTRVDYANRLVKAIRDLGMQIDKESGYVIKPEPEEVDAIAQRLGITTEAFQKLYNVAETEGRKTATKIEQNNQSVVNSTSKQVRNARQEVLRMYDTIAKDPNSEKIANEILHMTQSGSVNMDQLTDAMNRFRTAVAVSGADVETWGQKFKKAFASQVRSALASLITVDVGQFLKGIYDNVVALDDAVVNLQIASGKSRAETKALVKEYAALAKQLKATTAEVAASADTWLRQGYSAKEAQTMITNSMMLSKLGQIESEEAATALTSAMKGYKVAVEDTVNIVDKLTAVDMEAAASAGGIATAMAETSASANLAGVSMDTLIGYIATVKEVTQDSDESVGTFFKTMFARMGNIKVGKFVDEDGESLNDVETVLGELGIKLRTSSGEFRDFSSVLDEVGERWSGYNDVQKHAIATAVAGTRQQEKFLTLMSNYDTALDYATTAINSAGTATEKYGAYTDGVTAKINELKAAFEELSLSVLDSDFLSRFIELLTKLTGLGSGVANVIDSLGGLSSLLTIVSGILITTKYESIVKLSKSIFRVGKTVSGVTKELGLVIPKFIAARAAGTSFGDSVTYAFNDVSKAAGTAQMKIGLVSAAISIAVVAIGAVVSAINKHNAKMEEQASNLMQSAEAHANNARAIMDEIDALSLLADEYDDLTSDSEWKINEASLKRVKELQQDIADLVDDQKHDTDLVNGALEEQKTILADITKEKYEQLKLDAAKQKEDAKEAYRTFTNKTGQNEVRFGSFNESNRYRGVSDEYAAYRELLDKYKVDYDPIVKRGLRGVTKRSFGIQTEYSSIDDFVAQYENLKKLQDYLIESKQASSYSVLYGAINTYMKEYGELYSTYADALKLEQEIEEWRAKNTPQEPETHKVVVEYKGIKATLDEVAPAYDALSEALSNVTTEGVLTADALSALLEAQDNEGKIGGLKLMELMQETEEGYVLATDALEQYVEALVNKAIVEAKVDYADEQSKLNAIKNLETLMAVLATLEEVQDDVTNSADGYKKSLESQKDALNERLDAYKELIDLRKELIESYAEELEYQRELEKKQRSVASLQTKLEIARLDDSAAGQARVRELESQLQEAQEELDDYTLDHAINEILSGLDNQYSEYERFIKAELEKIEAKLDKLQNPGPITVEGLDKHLQAIQRAIGEIKGVQVGVTSSPGGKITPKGDFELIVPRMYHSGGFVGGAPTLANNEEFAKLLEGEFVSTPSQIKNFMTRTLPQMASFSSSGGQEFHAPLVEIKCESVTSESMPRLKEIVDEAVGEIKRCLDGGMSRTGYKRSVKKLLT